MGKKRRYFTTRQRQEIVERFNGICQACGKEGLSPLSTDDAFLASIDHIVPLSRGGSNDDDNIQLLCLPCNLSKGQMNMEEFMNHRECVVDLNDFESVMINKYGVDEKVFKIVKSKLRATELRAILSPILSKQMEVMSNE